ncbi:hypothetical protein DAPPUDRAFT_241835 [Daphnia pulex]|uniref:Uncharacterized protein n=1 Tax=Daphnia pulex TaxID=6669 RepID=E9GF70_DAPPU|nr:hypothetical protein DAPPUDRAFT_241835 [Daphnia pulex]|eukprot:EFX81862.1 hypothetical protein DAPPUDRAFT_241835 [Daphnia pulex]
MSQTKKKLSSQTKNISKPNYLLETKDVPNGRRRDPAEPPGFRPTYRNMIFGAPDSGVPSQAPLSRKIRPEQKRKRNLAHQRGEVAPWTGPIREPLYKNTREGRREEYRNRPIVPCAVLSNGPVIIGPSPEQREINFRRVLDRFAATDPPPSTYQLSPADIAEYHRLLNTPCQDYRITRGLLHGPRQRQPIVPVQAVPREEGAVATEEEKGAVGGEDKKEEGAVGGEDSEEVEALQLLYESLSIEEPIQAPIPPTPKPTEPTRQGWEEEDTSSIQLTEEVTAHLEQLTVLPNYLLETKDVPNGRRRDPAEPPGFRPTYENIIFGAPDRSRAAY